MTWSVQTLLDFSFVPVLNSAFEGTWAHGDPPDFEVSDASIYSSSEQDEGSVEPIESV